MTLKVKQRSRAASVKLGTTWGAARRGGGGLLDSPSTSCWYRTLSAFIRFLQAFFGRIFHVTARLSSLLEKQNTQWGGALFNMQSTTMFQCVALTGRWCWCPGPRSSRPAAGRTGQSSASPRPRWTGRGRSARRLAPGGTEGCRGRANGRGRSSERGRSLTVSAALTPFRIRKVIVNPTGSE